MRISAAVETQIGPDHVLSGRSNEDAHHFSSRLGKTKSWGAVLDGHGSDRNVAELGAQQLHRVFLKACKTGQDPMRAMRTAYLTVDNMTKGLRSGACAATFFLDRVTGELTFGNAGDVRILLVTALNHRQLTVDHRANTLAEKRRVVHSGGTVDGNYITHRGAYIMVARALGDHDMKSGGVIATPRVGHITLPTTEPVWIVTASDGLWDYMKNHEVARIARRDRHPRKIATELKTMTMLHRRGHDDFTALVLRLNG